MPTGLLLVVLQAGLRRLKGRLVDHPRHRDGNPALRRRWLLTIAWTERLQGRLAPLGTHGPCTTTVGRSDIGSVSQDRPDARAPPPLAAFRRRDPLRRELGGHPLQCGWLHRI